MTSEVATVMSETYPANEPEDTIHVNECPDFSRFVVTTLYSVYELIVLSGASGDVLIRGGRSFPRFRRAYLAGSSSGGAALALHRIDVGLKMELHTGGRCVVTSIVQAISRMH